jgi:hypothetical protein
LFVSTEKVFNNAARALNNAVPFARNPDDEPNQDPPLGYAGDDPNPNPPSAGFNFASPNYQPNVYADFVGNARPRGPLPSVYGNNDHRVGFGPVVGLGTGGNDIYSTVMIKCAVCPGWSHYYRHGL